jgi:hypothetical protein
VIFEGPEILIPEDNPDEEILIRYLTFKEMTFGRQPEVWLQTYLPQTDSRPNLLLPVLRRTTFKRRDTLELRRRIGHVPWPVIESDYFQLSHADFGDLDLALKSVQRLVPTLPVEAEGLELGNLYGPPDVEAYPGEKERTGTFSGTRTIEWDGSSFQYFVFDDRPNCARDFDRAWLDCWRLLVGIAVPERLTRPIREKWDVEPRRFLDFLIDIEHNGQPEPLIAGNPFGPDTIRDFAG